MKESKSYEELTQIKRLALDKLDMLIQSELQRLHDLSSEKPLLDDFKIVCPTDYFTVAEAKEVNKIIQCINTISAARTEVDRNKAIKFLEITLLTRPIINPWSDVDSKCPPDNK